MKYNLFNKYLIQKIKNGQIKIGIIGLGYVGLPLAYAFSIKNIDVLGFDIDKKKIEILNSRKSYISYFSAKKIKSMFNKKFTCFNSFEKINLVDVIILCLPTPLTKRKTPDMSYIKNSMQKIKKYLRTGQVLSLESTTYPGTCRDILLPILQEKFLVGKNFFLVYSPEREDPGNKKFPLTSLPKVVGGLTKKCLNIGSRIYSLLDIKIIKVSSLEIAEFTKLLENIYRSVNIGMVNELKILCQKMQINIFEVIKAAKTKPFGFQAFYPGPGYGGHCIPIDPFLLTWRAKQFNFDTKFIKLSGSINEKMPNIILKKILYLKKIFGIKKIVIFGIAYKKNVDDIRESPSLKILELLKKSKITTEYIDPYIPIIKSRNFKKSKKSLKFNYNLIKNYDLSLILTDHDVFDYKKIKEFSNIILDCRGRYLPDNKNKIFQG